MTTTATTAAEFATQPIAPALNLRNVRDHASAVRYLEAKRAELVAGATMNVDQAERLMAAGDRSAAIELMAEAKAKLAAVAAIDTARVA